MIIVICNIFYRHLKPNRKILSPGRKLNPPIIDQHSVEVFRILLSYWLILLSKTDNFTIPLLQRFLCLGCGHHQSLFDQKTMILLNVNIISPVHGPDEFSDDDLKVAVVRVVGEVDVDSVDDQVAVA